MYSFRQWIPIVGMEVYVFETPCKLFNCLLLIYAVVLWQDSLPSLKLEKSTKYELAIPGLHGKQRQWS